MIIQEMSREECFAELARTRLGRLACVREGQPYVVPLYFAHDGEAASDETSLYSFSTVGQKIEWMRANPLVCVELDEVTSFDQWMSVVIFGRYEELPAYPDEGAELREVAGQRPRSASERHYAWQLLQAYPVWWQPGSSVLTPGDAPRTFKPVFYRIRIDRITGRRAVPRLGEPIRPRTLSPSKVSRGWWSKIYHVLFKWRDEDPFPQSG